MDCMILLLIICQSYDFVFISKMLLLCILFHVILCLLVKFALLYLFICNRFTINYLVRPIQNNYPPDSKKISTLTDMLFPILLMFNQLFHIIWCFFCSSLSENKKNCKLNTVAKIIKWFPTKSYWNYVVKFFNTKWMKKIKS